MEEPYKISKPTSKCAKCGREFKSLLAHLNNMKSCKDFYSADELQELRSECTKKSRIRKAETRKNYEKTSHCKQQRSIQNKKNYEHHREERLSKASKTYMAKTKSLQNFYKEIQYGPIFPCICCMRCLPMRTVSKMTDKFYQKLLENDMAKFVCKEEHLQIFDKWYLCSTCYRNLSNCDMPSQCFENGLKLATVPDCLKISDVGNQLLAKNLVFIKVRHNNDVFS